MVTAVSNGLSTAFLGGTKPRPAFVFTFYIHLVPKPLDGPIPAVIELSNVYRAVALLDLLNVVEAFTHVQTSFVTCLTIAMPRTFEFVCHVIFKLIPPDLFWVACQQTGDKFSK